MHIFHENYMQTTKIPRFRAEAGDREHIYLLRLKNAALPRYCADSPSSSSMRRS